MAQYRATIIACGMIARLHTRGQTADPASEPLELYGRKNGDLPVE